jgi:uncharacterized membrane protein
MAYVNSSGEYMMQNTDNVINKRSTVDSNFFGKALNTYADLAIALGLALLMLVFIYVPFLSHGMARFALGIVMIIFMPGYLFMAAVYPGKDDLGSLERAVLSVGLSIILVPFAGLFLTYTAAGINSETMLSAILFLVMFFMIIAFLRRVSVPAERRYKVDFHGLAASVKKLLFPARKDKSDLIVSALLICSILLIISVIGYLIVMPIQADQYTEFYLYGSSGNMSVYPKSFTLGEQKSVIMGIVNHEGMTKEYDLAVTLTDGTQSHRIHLDHLVLANNQTLEKVINLTPDRVGDNQNMRFLLYMEGSSADPYRECNIWVNVTGASANTTVVANPA